MSYFDDVFEPSLYNPYGSMLRSNKKHTNIVLINNLKNGLWTNANGDTIKIKEMSDRYIKNCLKIINKHEQDPVNKLAKRVMEKELQRRKDNHEYRL